MTDKDFILQSDVAAAVLCGISKVIAPIAVETGVFSLSNPADLMQTVIALGQRMIHIVPVIDGWVICHYMCKVPKTGEYKTYIEAVRHAVMALKDEK